MRSTGVRGCGLGGGEVGEWVGKLGPWIQFYDL